MQLLKSILNQIKSTPGNFGIGLCGSLTPGLLKTTTISTGFHHHLNLKDKRGFPEILEKHDKDDMVCSSRESGNTPKPNPSRALVTELFVFRSGFSSSRIAAQTTE